MSELQEIRQALKRIEKKQDKILALLEPGRSITSFNENDWLTTQQAVDLLGRSERTLYRRRDDKLIKCIKDGSEPRYNRRDIENLKYRYMR